MKINKTEILNGVLLLAFGAWIWWQTNAFPTLEEGYPGPSLFPRVISFGLMLSGALLLISKRPKAEVEYAKNSFARLVLGIGLVGLYPILHPLIGFIPTLGIICLVMGLLLGVRLWVAAVSALGTVLFIFLTFDKLLGVSL